MKHFFKILSYLILLFILTAEDCSHTSIQETKQKIQRDQFQQIEADFASNEISENMLNAFGERAAQKLIDLGDFITICLDEDLPKEFREQAMNMVHKDFYSENDYHQFLVALKLKENTEQCLLFRPENKNRLVFKIDSVFIIEEFQKIADFKYSGVLGFGEKLYETLENDPVALFSKQPKLNILVLKSEKEFGRVSENVWEIFFTTNNPEIRNLN